MTKKRFISEDDCYGYYTEIIDKEKELDLLLPNPKQNLTIDELVDLLNELNDKCDFLEIENEALEDSATKYAELYHKSLKENEQLKSEKEHYKKQVDELDGLLNKYEITFEELEEILNNDYRERF